MKFPLYFFGIIFCVAGNPIVGLLLIGAGFMAAE